MAFRNGATAIDASDCEVIESSLAVDGQEESFDDVR